MQNPKYYIQLDGLRAFAVLSVMIGHWMSWDTENRFLKFTPWNHGVILFFVLSGYLITQILLFQKEKIETGKVTKSASLKTFYIRRFLRIFPIYYLLIFYLFYINFDKTREYFPWLVSYTSNILLAVRGDFIGDFNHLWSLAIEEQFYLIWPFLIFFTPRNKILNVIFISILISFISRAICVYLSNTRGLTWMWGSYFTLNLVLPLALGAFLAYLKSENRFSQLYTKLKNPLWLYLSIIGYIVFYLLLKIKYDVAIYWELFDEYLFSVMCFFIILRASENGFKFIGKYLLEHDVVVFTGKISYGIYLYHVFIIGCFWTYVSPKWGLHVENKHMAWFLYFLMAYVLAIPSYYLIETPLNNLKRYFKY